MLSLKPEETVSDFLYFLQWEPVCTKHACTKHACTIWLRSRNKKGKALTQGNPLQKMSAFFTVQQGTQFFRRAVTKNCSSTRSDVFFFFFFLNTHLSIQKCIPCASLHTNTFQFTVKTKETSVSHPSTFQYST